MERLEQERLLLLSAGRLHRPLSSRACLDVCWQDAVRRLATSTIENPIEFFESICVSENAIALNIG